MASKKKETEFSSARAKVWVSLVTTTSGTFASLVAALVAAGELLQLDRAVFIAVAAVGVPAVFTLALALWERGPSRLGKLKDDLSSAYVAALDTSGLNPSRGGLR